MTKYGQVTILRTAHIFRVVCMLLFQVIQYFPHSCSVGSSKIIESVETDEPKTFWKDLNRNVIPCW